MDLMKRTLSSTTLRSVKRGLAQSRAGKTTYLGSFSDEAEQKLLRVLRTAQTSLRAVSDAATEAASPALASRASAMANELIRQGKRFA